MFNSQPRFTPRRLRQHLHELGQGVLRLAHRHAVAGHDDHLETQGLLEKIRDWILEDSAVMRKTGSWIHLHWISCVYLSIYIYLVYMYITQLYRIWLCDSQIRLTQSTNIMKDLAFLATAKRSATCSLLVVVTSPSILSAGKDKTSGLGV